MVDDDIVGILLFVVRVSLRLFLIILFAMLFLQNLRF